MYAYVVIVIQVTYCMLDQDMYSSTHVSTGIEIIMALFTLHFEIDSRSIWAERNPECKIQLIAWIDQQLLITWNDQELYSERNVYW